MSRRKVSVFMYTSLAASSVRDVMQATSDGEDTLAAIVVEAPLASEAMAEECALSLKKLKKELRYAASSIRAMNAEIDAAVQAMRPPKKQRDSKQLSLPNVALDVASDGC